ncbi:hypothetical protein Hanom_Chr15g01407941 [Helianthus anomalus]
MIKRTDGVQYFRPSIKHLSTLPAHDFNQIAQLDLNTPTLNGIVNGLKKILEEESRFNRWKRFKPAWASGLKAKIRLPERSNGRLCTGLLYSWERSR